MLSELGVTTCYRSVLFEMEQVQTALLCITGQLLGSHTRKETSDQLVSPRLISTQTCHTWKYSCLLVYVVFTVTD